LGIYAEEEKGLGEPQINNAMECEIEKDNTMENQIEPPKEPAQASPQEKPNVEPEVVSPQK
jgi:hypothetical protein